VESLSDSWVVWLRPPVARAAPVSEVIGHERRSTT
jgi:hypothetical protein